jgi:predicted ATP-grasp superfamily ATP-dependent carboligase
MANQVSQIREAVLLQNARGATRDIGAGEVPADAILQLQELQHDLENLARQARQV